MTRTSKRPNIQTRARMESAPSKPVLEHLLRHFLASAVVDFAQIRRVRRLLDQIDRLPAQDERRVWLRAWLQREGEAFYGLAGATILGWFAHAAEACAREGTTDADDVVAWLRARSYTARLSRVVRRTFAHIHEVPTVDVPEHVRGGCRVRAYRRLIGNDHLRALPVDGWPRIVVEVARRLAERVPY